MSKFDRGAVLALGKAKERKRRGQLGSRNITLAAPGRRNGRKHRRSMEASRMRI